MNTNRLSQKTYLIGMALLTALALSVFALQSAHRASAQTGTFTFTFEGDIDNNANSNASLLTIAGANGAFSLAIGDLGYLSTPGDVPAWCANVQSKLGATYPFEILAGNHEADGNAATINNYIACLPDRLGVTGVYGSEYYFDYGSARFILVAAGSVVNGINYDYTPGGTHYIWLQDRIREAKALGKWVIVGDHMNCITTGSKSCEIGQNFVDLIHTEHVDLLMQGHDHSYQRSKQLICATANAFNAACVADADDQYNRGAGTVTVISAAGGYRLNSIGASDTEREYFVKAMGSNGWFNFVTGASGSGSPHGVTKAVVSSTQMDVQFLPNATSNFSDSFSIVSGGPTATPAPPTATPTVTPTPPPGSVVMHVADMLTTDANGNLKTSFIKNDVVYWKVKIVDANNVAVSGATVNTDALNASNQVQKSTSAVTGADGWTTLMSWNTSQAVKPGTYSIKVTNVTKTGGTYNAGANVVTQFFFSITN
jgi:hypothetical protein